MKQLADGHVFARIQMTVASKGLPIGVAAKGVQHLHCLPYLPIEPAEMVKEKDVWLQPFNVCALQMMEKVQGIS